MGRFDFILGRRVGAEARRRVFPPDQTAEAARQARRRTWYKTYVDRYHQTHRRRAPGLNRRPIKPVWWVHCQLGGGSGIIVGVGGSSAGSSFGPLLISHQNPSARLCWHVLPCRWGRIQTMQQTNNDGGEPQCDGKGRIALLWLSPCIWFRFFVFVLVLRSLRSVPRRGFVFGIYLIRP